MNMKKILALLLVLIMALSVCGCGQDKTNNTKKSSDVSISDLEGEIKKNDENAVVNTTESEDGYSFTYTKDGIGGITIEGRADSNKMLESVVATGDVMNVDTFNAITEEQLVADAPNMNSVPMSRLLSYGFLGDFSRIVALLSGETNDEGYFAGLNFLIGAIQSPKTSGNWEFTITTDADNNTATITAEFVGK